MRQYEEDKTPLNPEGDRVQCPNCADPIERSPDEHHHQRGAR